jgi:hypothetical protein
MAEYRSEIQAAWFAEMRTKYNTDDDGVRQIMRDRQKQSMAVPGRKPGGFAALPTKRVKEISKLALDKRYNKADNANVDNPQTD